METPAKDVRAKMTSLPYFRGSRDLVQYIGVEVGYKQANPN